MTLRPRYLRSLAAASKPKLEGVDLTSMQIAAYVLVRRYPVLSMDGVANMEPRMLNQHLETLRGEAK